MTKLPHLRRTQSRNWGMWVKQVRLWRKLGLLCAVALLCYITYLGEALLRSRNSEAALEQAYLGLKLDVLQITSMGAPMKITDDDFEPKLKGETQ